MATMSSIEIQFVDEGSHLRVVCAGTFRVASAIDVLHRIRDRALESNQLRILVDWRDVSPPDTDFDRFRVGQKVAEILPPPFRVAVIYDEHFINKFAENTAVNRGAILLVSGQEQEAIEFLHETVSVVQSLPESIRVVKDTEPLA